MSQEHTSLTPGFVSYLLANLAGQRISKGDVLEKARQGYENVKLQYAKDNRSTTNSELERIFTPFSEEQYKTSLDVLSRYGYFQENGDKLEICKNTEEMMLYFTKCDELGLIVSQINNKGIIYLPPIYLTNKHVWILLLVSYNYLSPEAFRISWLDYSAYIICALEVITGASIIYSRPESQKVDNLERFEIDAKELTAATKQEYDKTEFIHVDAHLGGVLEEFSVEKFQHTLAEFERLGCAVNKGTTYRFTQKLVDLLTEAEKHAILMSSLTASLEYSKQVGDKRLLESTFGQGKKLN